MKDRMRIIAVGQYPPPLNGMSYITCKVVEHFRETADVITVEIGPKPGMAGLMKHLGRMYHVARGLIAVSRMRKNDNTVLYVACESGLGKLYVLAFLFVSRIKGHDSIIHHHSYSYVSTYSFLMAALCSSFKDTKHVFLCDKMRQDFEYLYGVQDQKAVVSNAAFVEPETNTGRRRSTTVTIGHLSNLCEEKGLYKFVDLVHVAHKAGINVRGVLAGPVANPRDLEFIERAISQMGAVLEYRGALYDDCKKQFYRDIDVFVFPTTYKVEAQPAVLFEALAAGCRVVSFDRGCISNQVKEFGLLVPAHADFVSMALDWLQLYIEQYNSRDAVANNFSKIHAESRSALNGLTVASKSACTV